MFNEKNLPRLIIATPIITILLFAFLIIYFFINSQYNNFLQESIDLEKEYLQRQKNILINENKRVHDYINYHRSVSSKSVHDELRRRVLSGENISNAFATEYEKKAEDKLKKQIINWVESIRYETNGYVWIHDTNHRLIAHPFRKDSIGIDDTEHTDAKGVKIFQKFVNIAKENKNGGFLEYYWARPEFKTPGKKIGFLSLDKKWNWVIGTGLYIDDIDSSIALKKQNLEKKIDKYVRIILLTALSLMLVLGIVSFFISQTIVNVFTSYRQKVFKKETALKEFNKMLKSKIDDALKEAKKKDKALLHQSRMAQMGEMISMIAHQWRQPLSEISGIFMELETAAKFEKADKDYIKRESSDANLLIDYMSKTIDDFRNFFKPAKTKELFSISNACAKAVTLSEATLKSNDIKLTLKLKKSSKINGYPSEYSQVILNLILNAKDVLIQKNIQNPYINILIDEKNNESIVQVSDNGGGISERIIDKIFEPYFSTKQSSGTGLGLYMSKMIIEENMCGTIVVKNENNGALFEVRIKVE